MNLLELYEVEPELAGIASRAVSHKRDKIKARHTAYVKAKSEAWPFVGWYARNPVLRSQEAWECLFQYICGELNI